MRTLVFAFATVFLSCNGAFAQSHATPNLQIGKARADRIDIGAHQVECCP
jgi:hypothetical protein